MRLRKYSFFEYIDSPNLSTIRIYRISECIDYINPRNQTILGSNYSLGQARTQMASGLGRLESSMNSFETRRTDLRRMVRSTASTMDSVQRSMNSTMTRFSSINDDVRSRYGTSYGSSTLSSLRSGIPQSGRRQKPFILYRYLQIKCKFHRIFENFTPTQTEIEKSLEN